MTEDPDIVGIKVHLDRQEAQRLAAIRERVEQDKKRTPTAFYLGQSGDGRAYYRTSGGGILTANQVGNLQPPMGAPGRLGAGSFDAGSALERRRDFRTVKTGDVKVFVRVVRNGFSEFYVGGDRTSESLIGRIDTTTESIQTSAPYVYGPGKDDWLLNVKTRLLDGATPAVFKIYCFDSSGVRWSYQDKKLDRVDWKGLDFWSSNGSLSVEVRTVLTSTSRIDPPISQQGLGNISGGLGGTLGGVEWSIEAPYLNGTITDSTQSTIWSVASTGPDTTNPLTAIFDFTGSTSVNRSITERRFWDPVPSPPGYGDDLIAVGGRSCDTPVPPDVTYQYGARNLESDNIDQTTTTINYFAPTLWGGNFQLNEGTKIDSINFSSVGRFKNFDGGGTVRVYAYCVEIYNKLALASDRSPRPAGFNNQDTSSITQSNAAIPRYIAPGVQVTDSDVAFESSTQTLFDTEDGFGGETTHVGPNRTTITHAPLYVFGTPGGSPNYYFTKSTVTVTDGGPQVGTSQSTLVFNGGTIDMTGGSLSLSGAAICQPNAAGELRVVRVEAPSTQKNIVAGKKVTVKVSKLVGKTLTEATDEQFDGTVAKFKTVTATDSSLEILGAYKWLSA